MALDAFLRALFDHGRLAVPVPDGGEGEAECAAAATVLDAFEADWRLDFPGAAPGWDREAALYGARILYRGAQGAVHRVLDAETLRAGFALDPPDARDAPAVHYSVDIALRFLPALARASRGASDDDPLVTLLVALGSRWPLSSVGMPGVEPVGIEPIAGHPGLLRLYVDRIIAAADVSRLGDGRVADGVRRALGVHDELSPALSRALPRGDDP